MMCEYFLMVVVFNAFNVSYSTGLQLKYGGLMPSLNLFLAALSMLLTLAAAVSLLCSTDHSNFGEFKLHFYRSFLKSNFMVTTLLYRVVLGLCLSTFNEVEEATITCFFLGIIFFIYVFGDRPYKAAYHKWRTVVIQMCSMVGLGTAMYYRSMRSTTPISVRTAIFQPAYVVITAIVVSLFVSALSLCYELYLKFAHCCPAKENSQ